MKLLFENWRKYLTEQVMLAPDGSSATIVFQFDGMSFEGREEELEFPIRNVLDNNRIPPEEVTLGLKGDTFTMTTRPDPGEDISEWASYVEGVYDEVHQELEAVMGGDLGRTPLGAHFELGPNVKEGAEVFWYETADGVMLSKDDPRLHDDAVKEVSGVITSISAPPDPTGAVTSTPEGPYVRVKHAGGTVEINPEWFGSVYMMGGGLASDPDQPRPDEERYLRNAPRGGE
jgi:hypothetical protein